MLIFCIGTTVQVDLKQIHIMIDSAVRELRFHVTKMLN